MASRRRIRQGFALASRAAHNHRLRRRPALEVLEPRVVLSTFTVNLTTDTATTTGGVGSGLAGDLRYCITQADANNQANQIVFDSTVFGTHRTITLGGSQLEMKDTGGTQTITGPAAGVTISGGRKSRDFQVDANVTASLSGLAITGGSANFGGGVFNDFGNVTLTACTVSGNSAGYGGGIENDDGTLTATNSTIKDNSAAKGGGIYSAGTATLTGTTVSGNSAVDGGGIEIVSGSLTIATTTISGNKAQGGGGEDAASGTRGTSGQTSLGVGIGAKFHSNGGNGGNGGAGGDAGNAAGGGLYVASGTVDLTDSILSDNTAAGGAGGNGGEGGRGGNGGGGTLGLGSSHGLAHTDGFSGGKGGTGGTGGTGGEGLGGGLYVLGGTLSVSNTTFAGNEANGGAGGEGGRGGSGGSGGAAAKSASGGYLGAGGAGGNAGQAGAGGEGGEGHGGGVYLAGGNVAIQYTTIAENQVSSQAGPGGVGGQGGRGGPGNPNGPNGASSSRGPSGQLGSSDGGGIGTKILATLVSTIVVTNTSDGHPSDVSGELDPNSSNNLFGTGGSGQLENNPIAGHLLGNIFNVTNPGLAPLGDYGGPTPTMALVPGSPAIGAGGLIGFTSPLTDQRGVQRPLGSISDIGAYETQPGIVVNTAIDGVGSPLGDLSLRQAVNLADRLDGAATITFAFAAPTTITLTQGQLELSDTGGTLTIDGPMAGVTLRGSGHDGDRVLQVADGVTAWLSGLTITGGWANLEQGNIGAVVGGGMFNQGTVTLTDCTISGNSAGEGGGVYNLGTATFTGCIINGNSSANGGLWNGGASFVGIDPVVAKSIPGTVTLTDCTISGNSGVRVGGVFNYAGTATLTNCTIGNNSGAGLSNGSGLLVSLSPLTHTPSPARPPSPTAQSLATPPERAVACTTTPARSRSAAARSAATPPPPAAAWACLTAPPRRR